MSKNKYIIFTAMGLELVGIILACLIVGKRLDDHFGTKGIIMIFLSMFGLSGWIYHIIVLAKKIEKSESSKQSPNQE